MIEDTIRSEKYSFENTRQKHFAKSIKVINRSESEDMKYNDIKIEVRIQNLYSINNYFSNIKHLPGVIEIDVIDSFKMICRRLERLEEKLPDVENPKKITISTKNLHKEID